MLILSLVCSLFFLGGACAAYPTGARSGGRLTAFLVCGFLAMVFSLTLNPTLLANATLLIVVGIVCRGLKASAGRFAWMAAVCTLLVYVGFGLSQAPTFLERRAIRERYPIESLSQRLEYERRAVTPQVTSLESATDSDAEDERATRAAPPNYARRLDALEEALDQGEWPWRSRSEALRIIHSSYVEQFIDSPGFGVARSIRMREPEEYAAAREPQVFKLPPADCIDPDGTAADNDAPNPNAQAAPTPATRQLETLHEASLFDFVNRRGWGYVRDRDHAAGFQPHQFRTIPLVPSAKSAGRSPDDVFELASRHEKFDRDDPARDQDHDWEVRKVQLVSLLKHDEPMVYVTDELPRMDRLIEVPVRPLDAFEQRSLRLLEHGEDVLSESPDGNRVRVVGALRAAQQCLKCHSVDRGELLGAFSYEIARTPPTRLKREPPGPAF
jgi:hypothetical protein